MYITSKPYTPLSVQKSESIESDMVRFLIGYIVYTINCPFHSFMSEESFKISTLIVHAVNNKPKSVELVDGYGVY